MTPRSQSAIHDKIVKSVAEKLKGAVLADKAAIVGGYAPQTQPAVVWVLDDIGQKIDANASMAVSDVLDALCLMTPGELNDYLGFHKISHGVISPGGDAGLDWVGSNPPTKTEKP